MEGKRFTQEEAIGRFKEIFPNYDYSKVEYKNIKNPVFIICNEIGHSKFKQVPELLLKGRGCPKCAGRENIKSYGYWNNLDNCIEEAKKYRNKFEFNKKSYGAYMAVQRNGWMEKIDILFDKTILYKNYNEKIHSIYIYKFEKEKTCYIGRTNSLKRRHRQHKNGTKHKSGMMTYDVVYLFCENNKIQFPEPIILEEKLDAKESQIQEKYWVDYFKEKGWNLLNKANTGENIGSLGATIKWDYEACKEESKKYNSKHEMKLNNQSAYNSSLRNGWIDKFFIQVKKPQGYWQDINNCKEEAKKYKNIKQFAVNCGGAYNICRKNDWVKLLEFKNTEKG